MTRIVKMHGSLTQLCQMNKLRSCINKSFRKDLNEFDAMVYEEGKLYERVLLQVLVYIFSFGISLLISGRGGDFVLKLPFYGAPLYNMPYFLHVLYFLWLNLEFSHTHREEEQLSCFSTLYLRKSPMPSCVE